MYEPAPEIAEGFSAEDYASDPVYPYPDNYRAYDLFCRVRRRWLCGPGGPIGLDFGVVLHKMDRMKLDSDEYDQLEADIELMEGAALTAMRPRPAE
ncbi:DUF1799 domain-containing protein [Massilia soli]|uniref:DUF1799 domain-containing protein n=1 Tax=Massilia soli TaxID=2792854 RepID=A0ABS7SRA4_9BURK|nr:DUF1799 domain-containing protein [Massilia soli]MBZ2208470.1 DUF1799 domain-containing protein [Massilia soli]